MRINLLLRLMSFAAALIGSTAVIVVLAILAFGIDHLGMAIARGIGFSLVPGLLISLFCARRLTPSLSNIISLSDTTGNEGLERHPLANARDEVTRNAAALTTSDRLSALGEIAAGVAHEVNNPLTYVKANLAQLRSTWSTIQKFVASPEIDEEVAMILSEGEELIDESIEGVEHAVSIVRGIKDFAHRGVDPRESVELNVLLERVLRMASPHLGMRVTVERRFGSSSRVLGSARELEQVFLNLIINASQAIPDRGTILIETAEQGNVAVVVIEDDGDGIEPAAVESLFDPFFTTKPVGQGTGLGLSISREIIERHGGEIHVESMHAEGARFSVCLPVDV